MLLSFHDGCCRCVPKGRLVPRDLYLYWAAMAALPLESPSPLRSQPTCKKEQTCCAEGDKTWVYFSSMQSNSLAAGKLGVGTCSVPPQTAHCHSESLWLCPQVGDGWWMPRLDRLPALGAGAARDGSVPAGATFFP